MPSLCQSVRSFPQLVHPLPPEAYKTRLCRPGQTVLQAATTIDFSTYLVDDILVALGHADRRVVLEMIRERRDHAERAMHAARGTPRPGGRPTA